MQIRLGLLVALLLCVTVAAASGQDDDSGLRVEVTTVGSGDTIHARLLALTDESVELLVNGTRQSLPLSQVSRIERRGDSLANGAMIGALALGAWCAVVCGQGLDRTSNLGEAVLVNAAAGLLVGAGIDAMITGRTVLYPKPNGRGPTRGVRLAFGASLRF